MAILELSVESLIPEIGIVARVEKTCYFPRADSGILSV